MSRTYIAHDKTSGITYGGSFLVCSHWAFERVKQHPKSIIAIIRARPSEDGLVVAEVDVNGGCRIFGGRYMSKRELSKLARRVANG